jgi:hypothetical protein
MMMGIIKPLKLPAHPVRTGTGKAGLPGKVISFYIVPLDPAYRAGLAGHVPVNLTEKGGSRHAHV